MVLITMDNFNSKTMCFRYSGYLLYVTCTFIFITFADDTQILLVEAVTKTFC